MDEYMVGAHLFKFSKHIEMMISVFFSPFLLNRGGQFISEKRVGWFFFWTQVGVTANIFLHPATTFCQGADFGTISF